MVDEKKLDCMMSMLNTLKIYKKMFTNGGLSERAVAEAFLLAALNLTNDVMVNRKEREDIITETVKVFISAGRVAQMVKSLGPEITLN